MTDQGALSILSNIIKNYSSGNNPNDQIDVEIQSDVLFVLTCICENDLHRKVSKKKGRKKWFYSIENVEQLRLTSYL